MLIASGQVLLGWVFDLAFGLITNKSINKIVLKIHVFLDVINKESVYFANGGDQKSFTTLYANFVCENLRAIKPYIS